MHWFDVSKISRICGVGKLLVWLGPVPFGEVWFMTYMHMWHNCIIINLFFSRRKGIFTRDKLKMFLKISCERSTPHSEEGIYIVMVHNFL